MKKRSLLLSLIGLFALSSCDFFNETQKEQVEIIGVSSVTIYDNSVTLQKDETYLIVPTVLPKNADQNVTYSTSDSSVATVTDNGLVRAMGDGTTTITVTSVQDTTKFSTLNVRVNSEVQPPDVEPDKNGQFYGGLVTNGQYTGYEFSKSKSEIAKPTSGVGNIDIYSFNDFHGAILEKEEGESGKEIGLKRFATLYKDKSQKENTLILDQGDTWQGSFESNYQHGALIQEVFTYAGVSLRTVGNHDFDWGLSYLQDNTERTVNGDYLPTLAANVFDYDGANIGTSQQSQLGKEYATFVLDNGIKVGVVGVIGDSQITSICSQLVSEIAFTSHVEKVKEISDFLRINKDCDVVIASTHEGSKDIYQMGLSEVSPISNKRYVDLVLGGHSHYDQEYTVDGVKYVQWSANGADSGYINLKYDFSTNQLIDSQTSVNTFYPAYYEHYYPTIDPVIEEMVDTYLDSISSKGEEVLSENFSGYFDSNAMARVMTEAIHDRVSKTYPDLDFACANYARTYFNGTTLTYSDLYKCFPFDNQIILMDVSSNYGLYSISDNFSYREDTSLEPTFGSSYKCAILDYVALHQNEERSFDRFPDAANGYEVFNDTSGDPPTYRDILYSYLKEHPDKLYNASDYQADNPHFVG